MYKFVGVSFFGNPPTKLANMPRSQTHRDVDFHEVFRAFTSHVDVYTTFLDVYMTFRRYTAFLTFT